MEIGLSLGSNLGDRLQNLQDARDALAALPGVSLVARSAVYETEPVDVLPEHADQSFLNTVVIIVTDRDVTDVADAIHAIEDSFGRVRAGDRNAPRPLDIDMIYADQTSHRTNALRLPHPRWSERRFVVAPLADVRPDLILPGRTTTVAAILLALPRSPKVVPFTREW